MLELSWQFAFYCISHILIVSDYRLKNDACICDLSRFKFPLDIITPLKTPWYWLIRSWCVLNIFVMNSDLILAVWWKNHWLFVAWWITKSCGSLFYALYEICWLVVAGCRSSPRPPFGGSASRFVRGGYACARRFARFQRLSSGVRLRAFTARLEGKSKAFAFRGAHTALAIARSWLWLCRVYKNSVFCA